MLASAASQEPAFGERYASLSDHDVVEDAYVYEFKRRLQASRNALVSLAGLGDARGVVVREYHGRRIE